jgi:hypothetical protein
MKVYELINRLSQLKPDDEILILSFSDADDISNLFMATDPDSGNSVGLIVPGGRGLGDKRSSSIMEVARNLAHKIEDEAV